MLGASYSRLDASASSQSWSRRSWFLLVAAILVVITLLKGIAGDVLLPDVVQASTLSIKEKLALPWTYGRPAKREERITLIAMWDDDKMATYLPSLFTSARHHADSIDLLFINVLRKSDRCLDVRHLVKGASNIRVECIDDAEDKRLIREYFCGKWDCSREQSALVDEELRKIADPIHVQFKPWRGSIYKRFIDPDTRWWAWVDSDIVLGDFKALWPWTVMDNFDVVTISEWDYGNIYLRVS